MVNRHIGTVASGAMQQWFAGGQSALRSRLRSLAGGNPSVLIDPSDQQRTTDQRRTTDDDGVSGFLVMIAIVVVVILGLIAIKANMGPSSGSVGPNTTIAAAADAAQAQQSLSNALGAAQTQLLAAQATGALSTDALHAAEPSITFTVGASSGPTDVSIYGDPSGSGAVNMATRSSDGTCWYLWWSAKGGAWYGAQTQQSSCAAPALVTAPAASQVTSISIGWSQSSFPSA